MGFFFKALAAIVTADAIDRQARGRPTRYWYPNQPGVPPPGTQIPYVVSAPPPAPRRRYGSRAGWDPRHPERS
jgi:hypothetical protein